MKILVIYYSFEGNTKFIAESIAKAVGADILELKPKKEMKTHNFMKYFWGGKKIVMKEKPILLPFDKNPQDYDILFIGTPVWVWTYAPPLYTFFESVELNNKKIALFCCNAGGKGKIFEKMSKILSGNEIVGEIDFLEPLKNDSENNRNIAIQWAKQIVDGIKKLFDNDI